MGSRIFHRWECERCHATDHGDDVSFQPKDWITLYSANPPKCADSTAISTLCDTCAERLDVWLGRIPRTWKRTSGRSRAGRTSSRSGSVPHTWQGIQRWRVGPDRGSRSRPWRPAPWWPCDIFAPDIDGHNRQFRGA